MIYDRYMFERGPEKQIQQLISEAYERIREAQKIATEHKLSFSFDVAYGMGGTFNGDESVAAEYDMDGVGWKASNHSC